MIPLEYLNQIVTGDTRELAKRIPDNSIDVIYTDPIYWQIEDYEWLSELAARVLRDGGDLFAYTGQYHMDRVMVALSKSLTFRWVLVEKKISPGGLIFAYRLFSHYIPLLWYGKGKARYIPSRLDFQWAQNDGPSVNHEWGKGISKIVAWLDHFTNNGDILLDPFSGGGAILAGAKMRGMSYIGFEHDPDTAERARQRVAATQPPLFVMNHEQMDLL